MDKDVHYYYYFSIDFLQRSSAFVHTRCQVESSLTVRCVPEAQYLLVVQHVSDQEVVDRVLSSRALCVCVCSLTL